MMNQVQCGAPLKKVSDIAGSSPALFVHAPFAQADDGQQSEDGGARDGQRPARREVARRQLWMPRQAVHLRPVDQQVERVQPAQCPVRVRAVQVRLHALRVQLLDALLRPRAQLGNGPELNRVRGARLRFSSGPFPSCEIGRATSELQSQSNLVCRLLLEKKKIKTSDHYRVFD